MTDNRGNRRQRALKAGKISFGNGSFEVDCTIRNFSDTGAQLKVPKGPLRPFPVGQDDSTIGRHRNRR